MKRILLIITLICMMTMPVFAVGGTYTTNLLFYMPAYGAYGTDEFDEYNAYMEIADLQITANETAAGDENICDVSGAMWTGNTETFITITYQDSNNTVDAVVPVKDEDNLASDSATHLATQQSIKAYIDAASGVLTEEQVEDYVGGMLGGTETNIAVDYQDASNDIDFVVTLRTEEEIEDFVGTMLGGTETLIAVDYQDASNDIDFVVTIPEDHITATMLIDDNSPADEDIYCYESTGPTGHWYSRAEVGIGTATAITDGLIVEADLSEVDGSPNDEEILTYEHDTTNFEWHTLAELSIAATGQTFYIGTTQVAINRGSGALTLAGLTLTTPDIGTPSAGTLTNCSFPTLNQNTTGTAANLSGTPDLPNGTTATTQSAADNSTKLATTAYADNAGGAATAWDDIGAPDANDEIDFGNYIIELKIGDFRIGDGGANYVRFDSAEAITFAGTFDIDLPNDSVDATDINFNFATSSSEAGEATTFNVTDNESESLACPIIFVDGATGSQGAESDDTDFTYNPSTGTMKLTALDLTTALPDAEVADNITIDLATLATTLTITDNESTAENNPIVFVEAGDLDGGDLGLESDGTCYYTPSTGKITTTGFVGALTGQADTVATITTLAPDTATTQATQASITTCVNLTTVGTIGTGTWQGTAIADAYVPDNITIDLATLATTITVTDNESTNEANPICFVAGADPDGGSLGIETDGTMTYNPSTGVITTTGFAGALTGNVTGNASGSSGSCTGLAATATALATARTIGGVSFDGTAAIIPRDSNHYHALGSDEDYSGITDTVTVGYTTAIGDLMYFDWTAGEWLEAQADAIGTTPAMRIALEVKNDGQTCLALVQGYIRDDDAFDFGAARIYLNDDTAGLCDDTAPAESGDQIQLVGIGVSADILYFCPSIDVGEI